MSTHRISVRLDGNDIIVNPPKLVLKSGHGTTTLRWVPSGNGPGEEVRVDKIRFDNGQAPFTDGQQTPDGEYTGTWDTTQADTTWKYDVTVSRNGKKLPTLDPEIQNGPPGGGTGGDDEPPSGA